MDNTVFSIAQGAAAIACYILVESIKKAGMPSKYAALVSCLLGAIMGLLLADTWQSGLVGGIIAGGFASGVYSGSKKMKNKN